MAALPLEIKEAAKRGWRIHPINPHSKVAILKGWQRIATSDLRQIELWAREYPACNWGVVCGPESGFFAVDVDDPLAMQRLEDKNGPVPEGLCIVTSRGYSLLYEWPNNVEVRPATKHPCDGIDVRGCGSYVVIPPSIHPSGHMYRYSDDSLPIPACPLWLLALILNRKRTDAQARHSASAGATVAGASIDKGSRTNHLVSLAGTMHRRGMDPATIEAALLAENAARCLPPLPEKKVESIARDIPARYPNPASSELPNGFKLVKLGELLLQPEAPPDYLVDGLLVRGTVSGVFAKPKVGKSTFARALCLAIAKGTAFLGRAVQQGSCVYLALEERQEEITTDFRAMGADGTEPIEIHADTAPVGAISALVALVRNQRPALVVIDPLFRLAHIRDEKAYAEVYAALGPLIDAARETGTHIHLSHHSGKTQRGDAIDSPLGSTALGGAVCTLITLKRSDSYRSIQTVQRIGADMPETVLSFDPEARQLSIAGTRSDADREEVEGEIVEYLKAAGERSEPEIVEHVEGATAIKRKALRSLVEKGLVQRAGTGRKGEPYKYSFACSEDISRTRKQESGKRPPPYINTGEMLVRGNSEMGVKETPARALPDNQCGGLLQ
jgi:hypothetical protein